MHTPSEYCPKCRGLRRMSRSLGLQTVGTPQGKIERLLYYFHCETCNTYISSLPVLTKEPTRPRLSAAANT